MLLLMHAYLPTDHSDPFEFALECCRKVALGLFVCNAASLKICTFSTSMQLSAQITTNFPFSNMPSWKTPSMVINDPFPCLRLSKNIPRKRSPEIIRLRKPSLMVALTIRREHSVAMLLAVLPRADVHLVAHLRHERPEHAMSMRLAVLAVALVGVAIGPSKPGQFAVSCELSILRNGRESVELPVLPPPTVQVQLLCIWR